MLYRIQVGFHSSVVDTQELVCGSHHVDLVGFAFSTLPVHELVDRFTSRGVLENDAHNEK